MKPIRVLIVEDSPVVAEHLRRIILADARLDVAGVAPSGEDALSMVGRLSPDVISMDIHLPGMQGFEATRRIMARHPTPIVIVSGVRSDEMTLTMEALRAGALAVVEKPVAATHESYAALAGKLCTQLAIMSEVKVVRQREDFPDTRTIVQNGESSPLARGTCRLIGVAASTGGPSALMQLFCGLGSCFPLPIVVVQHMTPAFLGGFADWLASVTPFPVSIVNSPTTLEPAHVYLAPSHDRHLAIRGSMAVPDNSPAEGVHRPSANFLFSSMARALGSGAVGIVLTGMGDDGAAGLAELKRAGSWIIAEDESTAAVYGMPAAAMHLGAVNESLPLPRIAPRVLEISGFQRKAT
jgi:two-component system, chemotaxis family, protein-glutamate methylesterase/glutaminase